MDESPYTWVMLEWITLLTVCRIWTCIVKKQKVSRWSSKSFFSSHDNNVMVRGNGQPQLALKKEPSGLPRWLSGKEHACQCRRRDFNPWVRKIPWRRKWQPTAAFLPGKSHGQRSLAGCSPHGHSRT